LPFGNGFQAWFEGNPGGQAVISAIAATWENGSVKVGANLRIAGRAQVHVHGNAPRVFGVKIGGGAGSSIGVPFSSASNHLIASLALSNGKLRVAVEQPDALSVNVTLSEVDVSLPVSVPVPRDQLFAEFSLPKQLVSSIGAPSETGFTFADKANIVI